MQICKYKMNFSAHTTPKEHMTFCEPHQDIKMKEKYINTQRHNDINNERNDERQNDRNNERTNRKNKTTKERTTEHTEEQQTGRTTVTT